MNEEGKLVLLATVCVDVLTETGVHEGRFLLDTGSQLNLVRRKWCRDLGLEVIETRRGVQAFSGAGQSTLGLTNFTIRSKHDSSVVIPVKATEVESVLECLPQKRVKFADESWLKDLPLADEGFANPGSIDGIFGAAMVSDILGMTTFRNSPRGGALAIETSLGYVIMGRVPTDPEDDEDEQKIGRSRSCGEITDQSRGCFHPPRSSSEVFKVPKSQSPEDQQKN